MTGLKIALLINIVTLLPVIISLLSENQVLGFLRTSYGPKTTSRDLLLAIYMSFLVFSIYFLVVPDTYIKTLLSIQIVYKLISVFTSSVSNPVVIANIMIAISFFVLISI